MTSMKTDKTPFRFVWRNAAKSHWFTATVQACDAPAAIEAFRTHVEKRLGKPLDAVVIDHFFYRGARPDPTAEVQVHTSDALSLRDFEHPFHYEFCNRVHPPVALKTA